MLLRALSDQNSVAREFLRGLEETALWLRWFDGFYDNRLAVDVVPTDVPNSARTKITRSLNEDPAFTSKTQATTNITKKIVYARPQVDRILEKRGGPDYIASQLADNTYKEGYQSGYELNNLFINGDIGDDAEDFDGLVNLVDASCITTDGQVLPVGGDDVKEQQQLAVEQLVRELIYNNVQHAIVNDRLFPRLVTLGKNLGYYNTIQAFGEEIPRILNTQIHRAGYGPSDAELLPFTETVGGNSNCSSIIMLSAGERRDVTAPCTGGLQAEYEGLVGTFYRNSIDLDMAIGVQRTRALWQSKGWRLAQL